MSTAQIIVEAVLVIVCLGLFGYAMVKTPYGWQLPPLPGGKVWLGIDHSKRLKAPPPQKEDTETDD